MSLINKGGGGGGETVPANERVTAEQRRFHELMAYDATKNRIVAQRAFETTVNTLGWGESHDASAAGENIIFTNNNSEITFSPSWYGLRDQAVGGNQGANGYVESTTRHYGDLGPVEPHGTAHASNTVAYNRVSNALGNHAVFFAEVILGEAVDALDWVTYLVYFGSGGSRILAFKAQFTGIGYASGATFSKWFGNPAGTVGTRRVEFFQGQEITTIMTISKGSEDGTTTDLMVRASNADAAIQYSRFQLREFRDLPTMIQREVIHSSDGARAILNTDNGAEIHLEDASAISLVSTGVQDGFGVTFLNTGTADRTVTVTAAAFLGFREGGPEVDLGTTFTVPVNDSVKLTVTNNSGTTFVNLVGGNRGVTPPVQSTATGLTLVDLSDQTFLNVPNFSANTVMAGTKEILRLNNTLPQYTKITLSFILASATPADIGAVRVRLLFGNNLTGTITTTTTPLIEFGRGGAALPIPRNRCTVELLYFEGAITALGTWSTNPDINNNPVINTDMGNAIFTLSATDLSMYMALSNPQNSDQHNYDISEISVDVGLWTD